MEIYKPVIGYEGIYEVSSYGNVKSFWFGKEKILKPGVDNGDYLKVVLCKNGKKKTQKVHQLVAQSFLDHVPCGMKLVVNHKDFNRQNNHLYNLEIVTGRDNSNRKHLNSSSQYTGVSWCKQKNKWMASVRINGNKKNLGVFTNEIDASNAYQQALKYIII